ncbi:MAG TPA: BatA domain-containing protein, partial [Longimicrobiales bacterium]
MGFLSPLLLVLGLAVAIPIVLHLFQRHQGPRLIFPALRYLRRAEKESARRIRLRQLLLLALRVAAIVFVALAAARPFIRAGGAGHEPTAAVIVLDNSLSTGLVLHDRRVLDDLKARALQITEQAAPDDRFWVIRAGTPWDPAVPGDAASAAQRIRETDVAAAGADLAGAMARARTLLVNGAERRAQEIDLVSDLQATSFPAPITAGKAAPAVAAWVPSGDVPTNAGIADVQVGGGLAPRAGERSTVQARVVGSRTDSIGVRLTLDGRTSAVAHAAAGSIAVLPFAARGAGLATGFVELDPDAFRGDDRRYFAVTVEPPPLVALAGQAPFADAALGVLADAGRIRRGDAGAADVVVAPGGAGAGAVAAGHTVAIIAPASPLELPAANQRLGVAGIPWRFGAPQSAGEAGFQARDSADDLTRALMAARVRQVYPLQRQGTASASDSVLLRLADGTPWAVRGALPSGGRFLLVASPLTTEATTLPTTSAMVPLLDHLTSSWASRAAERSEAAPGASMALPAGADHVLRPDGVRDSAS